MFDLKVISFGSFVFSAKASWQINFKFKERNHWIYCWNLLISCACLKEHSFFFLSRCGFGAKQVSASSIFVRNNVYWFPLCMVHHVYSDKLCAQTFVFELMRWIPLQSHVCCSTVLPKGPESHSMGFHLVHFVLGLCRVDAAGASSGTFEWIRVVVWKQFSKYLEIKLSKICLNQHFEKHPNRLFLYLKGVKY